MQRTINFTGRQRISRSDIQIEMNSREDMPPTFDAQFKIAHLNFPTSAKLYVEAYFRNTLQRFSFGSIGNILKPQSTALDEIDLSGPTLFRVRVVDESEKVGRLLAAAQDLRPSSDDEQDDRSSLLVVKSYPLGEQTWRLDFDTGGKPVLNINSRIPNAIGQIKDNAQFQSLILPAALREVLMYFLWNSEDEGPVADQWFHFAKSIHTERPNEDDPVTLMHWVDDVVESFSSQFCLCDMLLQKMEATTT